MSTDAHKTYLCPQTHTKLTYVHRHTHNLLMSTDTHNLLMSTDTHTTYLCPLTYVHRHTQNLLMSPKPTKKSNTQGFHHGQATRLMLVNYTHSLLMYVNKEKNLFYNIGSNCTLHINACYTRYMGEYQKKISTEVSFCLILPKMMEN